MFSRVSTSGKSVAKSGVRISQGVTAAGNMSIRQYSRSAFAMKSVETVAAKYETHSQGGTDYEKRDAMQGDHIGRQQNHIWTKEEIDYHLKTLTHHKPVTFSDKVMNGIMSTLYHTFNFITGYKEVNPTVKAIQWRLIVLESFAGVPGFVAAGFRHFKSLRMLKRDHGWIATLLEEAENERMHLLVCLKMFDASWVTRSLVICAQLSMTPFLFITYLIKPQAMHRFVGYLEETACKTYKNVIEHAEKPGNEIHEKWNKLPAPEMAINYWKLPSDATFVDTLKCMFADETHHRDVNHTFAQMNLEDPNPFIAQHRANALRALQLEKEGKSAWPSHKEEEEAAAAAAAKK